jgi:hypothetical protein
LPLAWRVEETEGAIGFTTQKELLDVVAGWLPVGQAVILLADRFYGTPEMIRWCHEWEWDYRLRLKSNLIACWGAIKTTTSGLALFGGHYFASVVLTGKRVTTNIGIIRDPGHSEPWIIAMSAKPGYLTTLGYSAPLRQAQEGHRAHVFGFQIARVRPRTDPYPIPRPSRPADPGHVSRPLLGGLDRHVGPRQQPNPGRKKRPERQPAKLARSKLSWFTRGIRRAIKLLLQCLPLPSLWGCLLN